MIPTLLLAVLLQLAEGQPQFSTYIYLNGECWVLRVTASDLAATPVWPGKDDSPPLPPRAAIAASRSVLRQLVKGSDDWELERVSLRRVELRPEAWVYEVQFLSPMPPLRPNSVGIIGRSPVSLVVLMDGTAISPIKGVKVRHDCRIDRTP